MAKHNPGATKGVGVDACDVVLKTRRTTHVRIRGTVGRCRSKPRRHVRPTRVDVDVRRGACVRTKADEVRDVRHVHQTSSCAFDRLELVRVGRRNRRRRARPTVAVQGPRPRRMGSKETRTTTNECVADLDVDVCCNGDGTSRTWLPGGIPAVGKLCERCDGKCVFCDSYVRPTTVARVCDECNYGSNAGKCVICGGVGVADAYYCKECTMLEKDRDGCPKIVNIGTSKTDLFYEKKKYGMKDR